MESLKTRIEKENVWDEVLWEEESNMLKNFVATNSEEMCFQLYKSLYEKQLKLYQARQNEQQARQNEQQARQQLAKVTQVSRDRHPLPIGFIPSVSTAAQDQQSRDNYYEKCLRKEHVRGGFVAHSMFIRFVKGARGEKNKCDPIAASPSSSNETTSGDDNDSSKRGEGLRVFKEEARGLVGALKDRTECSFLSESKQHLELPQSLVSSELLSMALGVWNRVQGTTGVVAPAGDTQPHDHVFFSHQGKMKRDVPKNDLISAPTHNADNEGKDKGKGTDKADKQTVEYEVDVMASVISEDMMKVIATIEYKPDQKDPDIRMAQRDMHATNTISLHKRICIGVDIAGGNDVSMWNITAVAYFSNPIHPTGNGPLFECSEIYSGRGLDALFSIALGIHEAAKGWKDDDTSQEYRLGPVVATDGQTVYKAYDDAEYRKPNLETIKNILDDPTAKTWTSGDEKVVILEMKYRPSNWRADEVPSSVFSDIMDKLADLHEGGKVHGDIRLANLLNSSDDDGNKGYIIDCDFVHRKKYPRGLQELSLDGHRHSDVEEKIKDKTIENFEMKEVHDIFSLGAVMEMFECVDKKNERNFKSVVDICKNYPESACLRQLAFELRDNKTFAVRLASVNHAVLI